MAELRVWQIRLVVRGVADLWPCCLFLSRTGQPPCLTSINEWPYFSAKCLPFFFFKLNLKFKMIFSRRFDFLRILRNFNDWLISQFAFDNIILANLDDVFLMGDMFFFVFFFFCTRHYILYKIIIGILLNLVFEYYIYIGRPVQNWRMTIVTFGWRANVTIFELNNVQLGV